MAKASPAIAAFNAGEWSPQMEGRTDNEKYPIAAHIQQNFVSLKQGPATYRPGTAYVQPVKNSANRTWLQRFEFSQTQAFVVEFGDLYCRFYTNHGPLLDAFNNIYEIVSPYAAADLTDSLGSFTLQIVQSGDVLYIAGGSAGAGYQPYTLTRFSNSPPNWVFAPYAPTDGPYADPVPLVPGQEIALVASAVQGTAITVNALGGDLFAPTDVGRLLRLKSQTFNVLPWQTNVGWAVGAECSNGGQNYIAITTGNSGASPPVHTSGAVKDGSAGILWLWVDSNYGVVQITAVNSATQVTGKVITRLPAAVVGTTQAITGISQANPAIVTVTNTFGVDPVFITGVLGMTEVNQIPYTNAVANGGNVTLGGIDSTSFSAYVSGGLITNNATVEWQLGAWSNTTEWPRAVAFYKDRLFWATKLQVFGSVPGLYNSHAPDFFGQQTTDSAMNELISGTDASGVCWLASAIILLIGTEGGEYGLDAANFSASPLGPSNVEILQQSEWRCRHIAAQKIGTSILYVQRAGRKVFAMDYNFYLNRYDSTDQSKFAYHMSIGGITSMAYQQEPWSVLWATRDDGTLLSYTFNREDNVTAWCRHNLGNGGIVESLAVIPAPDGARDELWMIVNRTVNGKMIRTVEYMAKPFEGPQAGNLGDAQSSCWYVDCGVQFNAPAGGSITGLTIIFPPIGNIMQVVVPNSFNSGDSVTISGVQYTGTANPNGTFMVSSATPTGFTVINAAVGGRTFNYLSGGAVSPSLSTGNTTITGLPAVLWNQIVSILADGGVQAQQVVSATGSITLQGTFNTVNIGFPYQGNLVPMRPEGGADVGTAQGKKKQGANLVIRLVDSAGGTIGKLSNQNAQQAYENPLGQLTLSPTNMEQIAYNYTNTPLGSPPPIQSGDFPVSLSDGGASDQDASDFFIIVQQNDPLPKTVVGLYPSYKVEDSQ